MYLSEFLGFPTTRDAIFDFKGNPGFNLETLNMRMLLLKLAGLALAG